MMREGSDVLSPRAPPETPVGQLVESIWKIVTHGKAKELQKFFQQHEGHSKFNIDCKNDEYDEDGGNVLIQCVKLGRDRTSFGRDHFSCLKILVENGADLNFQDKAKRTALCWAVYLKYSVTVTKLVELGAKIDVFDQDDQTPFHVAVQRGYKEMVELFTTGGNKGLVNLCDGKGVPPLVTATSHGHLEICRLLLEKGAEVDKAESKTKRTSIYHAVQNNHPDILELLLTYNPDLEVIDSQGKSILYVCCQSKDIRCFHKIIQEHPKFSKKVMDSRASDRTNAVIVACKQGNSEHLKYLLDNGATVNEKDSAEKTALHYCADNLETQCAEMVLEKDKSIIDWKDEQGYTPMALAVIAGNMNLLKLLIREGADIDCVDNEGHKLSHWAAVCGHLKMLEVLIEHKADLSSADSHHAYPIHYAAQMNGNNSGVSDTKISEKVLKKFIDAQVPLEVVDDAGRQPLLWAACSGNSESCRLLLKAGAKIDSVDKDGLTALHCAASRGHTDCIDILRKQGASVNIVDRNKCTPLFYAITLGNKDCTKLLLNAKADPNHVDDRGRNPAHCAAIKGCLDTIKLLEKEKCDLWHQNKRGDYPIHEAAQKGHIDVVKYLLRSRNDKDAVNVQNSSGKTLLHIAAATNNLPLCKVIINHNCDKNALMKHADKEFTPYDLAVLKGHRDTADYLKAKGALPYSDLNNVPKSDTNTKQDLNGEALTKDKDNVKSEKQSPKKQSQDGKKSPQEKGQDEPDKKAKDEAEKVALLAAAEKGTDKESGKKEAKTKEGQRKSPDHKVDKKEVAVGVDKANVGIVTDTTKEQETNKTAAGNKKALTKKQNSSGSLGKGNGTRQSPTSLKSEKSQKTQTVPIHVRNKGTDMGTTVAKGKVVETSTGGNENKRPEVQSPDNKGKGKKHATFDKDKLTDNEDSGNETDPGRSRRKKRGKYVPSNSSLAEEVQESVRRYQNKRNQSREMQQLKRAQIHTGPMHDIVMFSKMMDNYRKGHEGHGGEEEELDVRQYASWDGYLQDQLRFISHLYDNDHSSTGTIKETAKDFHQKLETEANQRKKDTDFRCNKMEEETERQRKKRMDMDKEMNRLADQTAKMFDNVRQTASSSLESAKSKNRELKDKITKDRDDKIKTSEDPHEKALLEKQAMADAYSERQDELDLERKEKYKHWNRRKDEEMRRRLLQAYRPYFPNDVFHTGQVCISGGRVKSAGRLRVESSISPRRPATKSPRPTSHKSDSTNYSVAQYKLKEDNTKVQMTPYGLRRVRNYERPTYAEVEDDLAEAIFFNRYTNTHEVAANWSRKYDGNIRPRTGLVFVEPRVYEDLVHDEKVAKQKSAQLRHQQEGSSLPSAGSSHKYMNGEIDETTDSQ